MHPRHLLIALATLLVATTTPSRAQTPEESAANLLYTDGKAAFEAGEFPQALTLFQQAYEVLQNDFIRFYLGRTHAALGQCSQALTHFDELRARLPPGPRELRRVDEVRCRLTLGSGHLDGYRCHQAMATLKPIARRLKSPENRRRYQALLGTARQCTDVFGTRTAIGQRAARLYAEARTALRKGDMRLALDLAQQSLAAKRSRPGASVEAIALGKLGRCQEAISKLGDALPHAVADDAHLIRELDTACRLSEADRLLRGGPCQGVLDMLLPLKGRLKGEQEVWRKQKIAWCRPRATDFLTDTPARKAAYKLFLAARKSRADARRATGLYQKALKLADMPLIRRELAASILKRKGCAAALEVLAPLPTTQRTHAEVALQAACERYKAPEAIRGKALEAHVAGIAEVLRLRKAGAFPDALTHLEGLATAKTTSLQALRLDLVYDTGRCEDFIAAYEGATPEVQAMSTEGAARLSECQVAEAPAPEPTPSPAPQPEVVATPAVVAITPAEAGSEDTLAWITLGAGAGMAIGGVAFAVLWSDAASRHAAASDTYMKTGAHTTSSAEEALAARRVMDAASADGRLYSGLGIGLGIAGGAALTAGLVLLFAGGDDPAEADGAALYPIVSPSHLGLGGRF